MKTTTIAAAALLLFILAAGTARATSSTTFYTPCTSYIQPYGVPHVTYDSYLNRTADFPTDLGLTFGLIPGDKFQAEAGFDLFLPGPDPWQFNWKVGIPEKALGKNAPGINLGMFGMGTEADVNNFNVLYLNVGQTFENVGSFAVGGYQGTTRDLLRSADGGHQDAGVMMSYYRTLAPLTDKVAVTADWMSGENYFGGGGAGIYTEINPYPNGLFTIQLDLDIDLKPKAAAPSGGLNGMNLRSALSAK